MAFVRCHLYHSYSSFSGRMWAEEQLLNAVGYFIFNARTLRSLAYWIFIKRLKDFGCAPVLFSVDGLRGISRHGPSEVTFQSLCSRHTTFARIALETIGMQVAVLSKQDGSTECLNFASVAVWPEVDTSMLHVNHALFFVDSKWKDSGRFLCL